MRFITKHTNKILLFAVLGSFLTLTSCGSYQYVGYDNDGIYTSNEAIVEAPVVEVDRAANSRADSGFYSNYFAQESQLISGIAEEAEIFTDIDSYNSNSVANETVENIPGNNAGWGQVNDQVVINIYDNGWNNWGWGWNNPWLWNGGFGWGWGGGLGWGWNRWGWGGGLGWGWNNPWLWNGGFGWGWGGGFGWGWNHWGWNRGFYGNNLAFNYGRRGAIYGRNNSLINNRSIARLDRNRNLRRGLNSRDITRRNITGRSIRNSSGTRLRRNANGTISRSSSSRIRRNSSGTRSNRSISTRPSSRRSTGNSVRRSSGSRNSSGRTMRSSRGSSRSSGSIRSGGGMRSSGGSRGGGSRGGGRRG